MRTSYDKSMLEVDIETYNSYSKYQLYKQDVQAIKEKGFGGTTINLTCFMKSLSDNRCYVGNFDLSDVNDLNALVSIAKHSKDLAYFMLYGL